MRGMAARCELRFRKQTRAAIIIQVEPYVLLLFANTGQSELYYFKQYEFSSKLIYLGLHLASHFLLSKLTTPIKYVRIAVQGQYWDY